MSLLLLWKTLRNRHCKDRRLNKALNVVNHSRSKQVFMGWFFCAYCPICYKFLKVIVLNHFDNLTSTCKLFEIRFFLIISFASKLFSGLDKFICFLGGTRSKIHTAHKKLILGPLLFSACVNNVLDGLIA